MKLKKVRHLPDYLLILFGLLGVPALRLVGSFVYTANAKQKEKLNSTGWYWNEKISCNRILLLNIRTGYYLFFWKTPESCSSSLILPEALLSSSWLLFYYIVAIAFLILWGFPKGYIHPGGYFSRSIALKTLK